MTIARKRKVMYIIMNTITVFQKYAFNLEFYSQFITCHYTVINVNNTTIFTFYK